MQLQGVDVYGAKAHPTRAHKCKCAFIIHEARCAALLAVWTRRVRVVVDRAKHFRHLYVVIKCFFLLSNFFSDVLGMLRK